MSRPVSGVACTLASVSSPHLSYNAPMPSEVERKPCVAGDFCGSVRGYKRNYSAGYRAVDMCQQCLASWNEHFAAKKKELRNDPEYRKAHNAYHNNYQKHRRATDPEWREAQNAHKRAYLKHRRATDPEWRERDNAKQRERRRKKKEQQQVREE